LITAAFPSALSRIYTFSVFPTNIYDNMKTTSHKKLENNQLTIIALICVFPPSANEPAVTANEGDTARLKTRAKRRITNDLDNLSILRVASPRYDYSNGISSNYSTKKEGKTRGSREARDGEEIHGANEDKKKQGCNKNKIK